MSAPLASEDGRRHVVQVDLVAEAAGTVGQVDGAESPQATDVVVPKKAS